MKKTFVSPPRAKDKASSDPIGWIQQSSPTSSHLRSPKNRTINTRVTSSPGLDPRQEVLPEPSPKAVFKPFNRQIQTAVEDLPMESPRFPDNEMTSSPPPLSSRRQNKNSIQTLPLFSPTKNFKDVAENTTPRKRAAKGSGRKLRTAVVTPTRKIEFSQFSPSYKINPEQIRAVLKEKMGSSPLSTNTSGKGSPSRKKKNLTKTRKASKKKKAKANQNKDLRLASQEMIPASEDLTYPETAFRVEQAGFGMADSISRIAAAAPQEFNLNMKKGRGAPLNYPSVPVTTESFNPTQVTSRQGPRSTGKFSLASRQDSEEEKEEIGSGEIFQVTGYIGSPRGDYDSTQDATAMTAMTARTNKSSKYTNGLNHMIATDTTPSMFHMPPEALAREVGPPRVIEWHNNNDSPSSDDDEVNIVSEEAEKMDGTGEVTMEMSKSVPAKCVIQNLNRPQPHQQLIEKSAESSSMANQQISVLHQSMHSSHQNSMLQNTVSPQNNGSFLNISYGTSPPTQSSESYKAIKSDVARRLLNSRHSLNPVDLRPTLRKKIIPPRSSLITILSRFGGRRHLEQRMSQFILLLAEADPTTIIQFSMLNKTFRRLVTNLLQDRSRPIVDALRRAYGFKIPGAENSQEWLHPRSSHFSFQGGYKANELHLSLEKPRVLSIVLSLQVINSWKNYRDSGKAIKFSAVLYDQKKQKVDSTYIFELDVVKAETKRSIWIYKNDSCSHGNSTWDRLPHVQQVPQVCLGDEILISIPVCSPLSGQFMEFSQRQSIVFEPLTIAEIPPSIRPLTDKKFERPYISDLIYNVKKLVFYKEDYFRSDLKRVCEAEELITEWYELDLANQAAREQTLETFGFRDLLGHSEDFSAITNHFQTGNLRLDRMEIGGQTFRIFKLHLTAQSQPRGQKSSNPIQYYPLLQTFVSIRTSGSCLNEVKKQGYLIDQDVQPVLDMRAGDSLVVYLQVGGEER